MHCRERYNGGSETVVKDHSNKSTQFYKYALVKNNRNNTKVLMTGKDKA